MYLADDVMFFFACVITKVNNSCVLLTFESRKMSRESTGSEQSCLESFEWSWVALYGHEESTGT